jgi:hypothetical protein
LNDGLAGFGQVTVIVDRIDDGDADLAVMFDQARHLQLPKEVFLQRLAAGIAEFLGSIAVPGPGSLG